MSSHLLLLMTSMPKLNHPGTLAQFSILHCKNPLSLSLILTLRGVRTYGSVVQSFSKEGISSFTTTATYLWVLLRLPWIMDSCLKETYSCVGSIFLNSSNEGNNNICSNNNGGNAKKEDDASIVFNFHSTVYLFSPSLSLFLIQTTPLNSLVFSLLWKVFLTIEIFPSRFISMFD